jgi:hypothetical protein
MQKTLREILNRMLEFVPHEVGPETPMFSFHRDTINTTTLATRWKDSVKCVQDIISLDSVAGEGSLRDAFNMFFDGFPSVYESIMDHGKIVAPLVQIVNAKQSSKNIRLDATQLQRVDSIAEAKFQSWLNRKNKKQNEYAEATLAEENTGVKVQTKKRKREDGSSSNRVLRETQENI